MGAYRVNISHSDPPFPAFTEKGKAPLRLLVLNTVLYAVESNHHDGIFIYYYFFFPSYINK